MRNKILHILPKMTYLTIPGLTPAPHDGDIIIITIITFINIIINSSSINITIIVMREPWLNHYCCELVIGELNNYKQLKLLWASLHLLLQIILLPRIALMLQYVVKNFASCFCIFKWVNPEVNFLCTFPKLPTTKIIISV